MDKQWIKKSMIFCVLFLLIGTSIAAGVNQNVISTGLTQVPENRGTEYWALLVAVGVYADDHQQDRPDMLEEVDDLYDLLVQSPQWSEDHIKVIKGKDATITNILAGFRWLDSVEDSDDFSLVYLTTHGFPLGFDIPPKDEADGFDEALVSYWGFAYTNLFIWDDQINIMLNRLESQGVCLIVDSCYAGGFNDPPTWNATGMQTSSMSGQQSAEKYVQGFVEDVRGQNRVVLMASREDEVSYSGGFGPYLIDGLRGYADVNDDGIVTAEEAFYYAEPRSWMQHPTIADGYPGEFALTEISTKTQSSTNDQLMAKQNQKRSVLLGDATVCGYIVDDTTSDPISSASVNIRGRIDAGGFYDNDTTTDGFGLYTMQVPAGRYRVTAYADGYCSGSTSQFTIIADETFWVNVSLFHLPPEHAVVCGYITDVDTSNPINGANVNLQWQDDLNHFYQNDTVSEGDGFYSMNVAAGQIDLSAFKSGYFPDYSEEITIPDYETTWMNISLHPRPAENAILCGYITDGSTEDPMDNVRVDVQWVDIELGYEYTNETETDPSGFFSINVAPGELYVDIYQQGYEYYDPYRHDAIADQITWMNISLITTTIEVEIEKPLQAMYIKNERLIPFTKTLIIGSIDITAYIPGGWFEPGTAERVEFYIDDVLKATVTTEPYNWTWSERSFGKHVLKVVAYDDEENSASKEIEVIKIF